MSLFRRRNVSHSGLFTFPESAQHTTFIESLAHAALSHSHHVEEIWTLRRLKKFAFGDIQALKMSSNLTFAIQRVN